MTVNWKEPLQAEVLGVTTLPLKLLTFNSKGDKAVVELADGTCYFADKYSGVIEGQKGFARVINRLEPWKEAFDQWKGQPREQDYSIEQTFKEAFELGRSWK
jgi:hypothetical protein